MSHQTSQSLNIHWKDWWWGWSSNTSATWGEELTHWKKPWCWERLRAEEGDGRRWDGWVSLQSKGLSRVFSNTTVQKHQFFGAQLSSVQLSYPYMTNGKTIALTRRTFVWKVMSMLLIYYLGRRMRWHTTPILLPRKSHGRRSLVGCSPWGHKKLDTTEVT